MVVKSKKIRIYPTSEQRQILRNWFGASRFVYNQTIEFLKAPNTKANWKGIKTNLIRNLPSWTKEVPYQIKSVAIRDACNAVKNAKIKYRKTGVIQSVNFRKRKDKNQSLFIPKSAIKRNSVYRMLLGKLLTSENFDNNGILDCRLVIQSNRMFIVIPCYQPITRPENQRLDIVSIDPGVRTFLTFYSSEFAGKIGSYDYGRVQRLCYHLDVLISKMTKAKGKNKYRMKRALDRLRWKIKDVITDIHCKSALFFCRNFKTVIIPVFNSSKMVKNLHSKIARAMLTWSHYKFLHQLKSKAREYGTLILSPSEAYTSKTCSRCGEIVSIGTKKKLKCKCGVVIDRDYNGARNILFRALGDTPWLMLYQPAMTDS